MSCMLPTATLRCACCAVFILPNITALLLLAGCRSSQWQRRITAIARYHQAVAWLSPPARSCTAASRCTWWPPRLTARLPLQGQGFGGSPWHTNSTGLSSSAVRHSGQSLRSCQRHITAFGLPAGWPQSVCAALVRHAQASGAALTLRRATGSAFGHRLFSYPLASAGRLPFGAGR